MLGIAIPVGVIFIVVVTIIIVKVRNNKNSIIEGREVVKIEDAGNSPGGERNGGSLHEDIVVEDNTANNLRIENKQEMKSTAH